MSKDNNQPLNREQIVTQLSKGVSPAELSLLLQQLEVSDKKDTIILLEQLNEEFASNGGLEEDILVPVVCSIVDGFLECSKATRKLRRKGITASRIVQECKAFSYPTPGDSMVIQDAYTEYKSIRMDFQIISSNLADGISGNSLCFGVWFYGDKTKRNGWLRYDR